jgi:cytochrome P450
MVAFQEPRQASLVTETTGAIRYEKNAVVCWYSVLALTLTANPVGTAFRYAPHNLVINAPTAYRTIFGPKGNVRKSDYYKVWPRTEDTVTTWSTTSIVQHGRKRRVLNFAFSESALRGAEPFNQKNVDRWLDLLGQQKNEGRN